MRDERRKNAFTVGRREGESRRVRGGGTKLHSLTRSKRASAKDLEKSTENDTVKLRSPRKTPARLRLLTTKLLQVVNTVENLYVY